MNILVFILSLIIGTIVFLILTLFNKLKGCGVKGAIIAWILCWLGAWIIILLLGKLLVGLLLLLAIGLIIYSIIACIRD